MWLRRKIRYFLRLHFLTQRDLAALAKKLPVGRLYANGRGFVPNVRQELYSKVLVALVVEPKAATSAAEDSTSMPVASGLPRNWDEIEPGHLVIAQESHENGWWEAIVIERKADMLTLRFRDFPQLPKFARHRSALALMSPGAEKADN